MGLRRFQGRGEVDFGSLEENPKAVSEVKRGENEETGKLGNAAAAISIEMEVAHRLNMKQDTTSELRVSLGRRSQAIQYEGSFKAACF